MMPEPSSRTVRIHWLDSQKQLFVDGSTLPAGTELRLVSAHHRSIPVPYYVYEIVPKVARRGRAEATYEPFDTFDGEADDGVAEPITAQHAEHDWALAGPREELGHRT